MYTTIGPLKTNGLHPTAGYNRPGAVHWIYIGAPAITYLLSEDPFKYISSSVNPDETPHHKGI